MAKGLPVADKEPSPSQEEPLPQEEPEYVTVEEAAEILAQSGQFGLTV